MRNNVRSRCAGTRDWKLLSFQSYSSPFEFLDESFLCLNEINNKKLLVYVRWNVNALRSRFKRFIIHDRFQDRMSFTILYVVYFDVYFTVYFIYVGISWFI